ncbi:transcriptional regulator, AraC family [Paenibacillus curdlanolyticus YK9]|uniref:Transcriptional regulator, AraC family n=1 Tax=Paenibacillus curdlanolyticus YK9 TaxID=717606 RepID=E0IG56_9BACL|nr:AraC family transcriptional regulator [Paenibacillus curdlanolyticus]EFM08636.1 transcriptional regulator, AraC family [Paenibacillus curdlanolyticus YK9]
MHMQIKLPQLELHKIVNRFENVPHAHESDYQLTIPTHGTCHFTYENKQVTLSAGEGLLLHPRDRHSFHLNDEAGVIIVVVKDQRLQPLMDIRRDEQAVRHHFEPTVITRYFRQWTSTMFEVDALDRLAAEETELRVLGDLQGLLADSKPLQPARLPVWSSADPHIARVLEYVHAHYTEQLDIDSMAAVALQSRFHFIRSFKSATGFTPYQYVLYLRMEQAKQWLAQTVDTVTDISFKLGFSSASQFYRAFEKSVGTTPEQYRAGI